MFWFPHMFHTCEEKQTCSLIKTDFVSFKFVLVLVTPVTSHTCRRRLACRRNRKLKCKKKVDRSEQLARVRVVPPLAREQVCVRDSHLAGERQRGRHLLHGQVADARGERASAGRAAAQLLAALVTHQVTRLTLQDGRQHVVEAYRALEQPGELRGPSGQAGSWQGHCGGNGGGGGGSGPRPRHGAHTDGCCCCCCGRRSPVLPPACFPGPESSTSGSGSG